MRACHCHGCVSSNLSLSYPVIPDEVKPDVEEYLLVWPVKLTSLYTHCNCHCMYIICPLHTNILNYSLAQSRGKLYEDLTKIMPLI